jgi:hypothetical protein
MIGVLAVVTAVLAHLHPFTIIDLAFDGDVVTTLALGAFEGDFHPFVISGHFRLRSIN